MDSLADAREVQGCEGRARVGQRVAKSASGRGQYTRVAEEEKQRKRRVSRSGLLGRGRRGLLVVLEAALEVLLLGREVVEAGLAVRRLAGNVRVAFLLGRRTEYNIHGLQRQTGGLGEPEAEAGR